MSKPVAPSAETLRAVGLCATCAHARTTTTARGSTFYRCARAESDARFVRYPRLPVVRCGGFEEAGVGASVADARGVRGGSAARRADGRGGDREGGA
jgi:hypothetical protein